MLLFPNSKVNLGLKILRKRADGFHDIETVFYPLRWCEALEVIENPGASEDFQLTCSGLPLGGNLHDNLIYRVFVTVKNVKKLPPVKVHLHKVLPMGAGLGGGSADAAFFLKLLDQKFDLKLSKEEMRSILKPIGSDCAFFLENKPLLAEGRGDQFSPIEVDLGAYYILIVHPGIHSHTAEAYAGIMPGSKGESLRSIVAKRDVSEWKEILKNDFETSIFRKYPEVEKLKRQMYEQGAIYASMSGSGSAVFGIFGREPGVNFPPHFKFFLQKPEKVFV